MTNIRVIDRTKAAVMAMLIALSLVASALPASAGYKHDGLDFIDATGITWEKGPKNITWEKVFPKNVTWEYTQTLRSITWE